MGCMDGKGVTFLEVLGFDGIVLILIRNNKVLKNCFYYLLLSYTIYAQCWPG